VYAATPVMGAPVEERFLALDSDGQELVDIVFWDIVRTIRPPVVKTGGTGPSRPSFQHAWPEPDHRRAPAAGRAHHGRNRERSPPTD
jgi:hypothetical protein